MDEENQNYYLNENDIPDLEGESMDKIYERYKETIDAYYPIYRRQTALEIAQRTAYLNGEHKRNTGEFGENTWWIFYDPEAQYKESNNELNLFDFVASVSDAVCEVAKKEILLKVENKQTPPGRYWFIRLSDVHNIDSNGKVVPKENDVSFEFHDIHKRN
ncbi:hypothetical protein B0H94_12021 [Salsuginibacillus halophilus]|uniref:Uncharacterized protein n=1 Tax=Salsuginibacillus halophilus TaxID=517424 RepID=A0A2P8H4X4_9BACI|nr:hypothetical protein [Salsuginibacillus halophilus]PSL41275.1 hypothetical protein B0H94_12021 [Salsuginibacillus halophilus]